VQVTVKFFARLRDLVGAKTLIREVNSHTTIAELIDTLQAEFPQLSGLMPSTAIALNQEFADPHSRLNEGDEVALFPPVSGGAGSVAVEPASGEPASVEPAADEPASDKSASDKSAAAKFSVTFEPITLDEVAVQVVKPETGAVAVFAGVVRNVSGGQAVQHLEYEAYEEMAVAKLRQVADEARQQWPSIVDMAIVQRIGHLEVGEIAVVVAVSSPHRDDGCFEACAYAINRLKEIVPIWKKEVGPTGAVWIEGDYLPSTKDTKTL
jgi:molybdopterin synthase catalytic subunit